MHTKVDTTVSKVRSNVSLLWNSKWGAKPADSDDYSFNKAVPDKDTNESHFKHGGQELVTNREAENMPKLPYEITYREAANSDDPTWNATTARYTAKKRTITLTDGVSGDVVISNNNGNYSTDSWAGSTALDDSDYYFDSLKLTVTEFDASKLGDSWSNPYEHTPHTNYGHTQIWVRKANSNTFTLHRELVVTESDTVVNLPADTAGFKIIHESEFFSTNLGVKTNLCLKPTAKLAALVTSDIQNNLKTLIKNKSLITVECENAKPKNSFVLDSSTEDDDFNIDNNTFWTTEPPENLNDVTAVAVDCRFDDKGNPFALKPESTIGFEINMHSKRELDENDIYTYNEAVIRFMLLDHRTTQRTQTDVLLHFGTPELAKAAFPSSGTEENPAAVVKNSILEYTLNVTNTDAEVQITDITVNDTLDATKLRIDETNLAVKVGDGDETPIGRSVHIKSYELTRVGDEYRFSAVIASIDELETVSIIIPVTVIGEKDETIVNQADISAIYGADFIVNSNPTYHIIDDPQAKVLKVNSKDEPFEGATLTILNDDSSESQAVIHDAQGNAVTSFTSGADILSFSIMPGRYILRELSTPNDEIYKKADDIKFRIDSDGFAYINGVKNDIIKMVNEPKYKVVFHENNPESNDKNVVFRIYEPNDLDQNKMIAHFYDIPKWAGDEYVFAGWYHNSGYTEITEGIDTPSNFEQDSYPARDGDYHLYARWIKVGTVSKDSNDANLMNGDYRGFGLEGVQIRNPEMYDSNYETVTPGGMRFVTSLKESLLSEIDALSSKKVSTSEGNVDVEYGYAVGTEKNIKTFTSHYGITDPNNYQMQYKGENVNGINTTGKDRTPETDFRFITNVNCTRGTTNADGTIKEDHRNFANYRLYTLVVTYEGNSAGSKNEKLAARSYIRYYDANGKLRVFYNTYKKSMYGGCMCSFNQVAGMAIP